MRIKFRLNENEQDLYICNVEIYICITMKGNNTKVKNI